jgi:hypothetical protein
MAVKDQTAIDAAARERFYDTQIAPALLALAVKASDAGLSFLAVVEWAPNQGAHTSALAAGAGSGVRHALVAARAGSNVDALIMALMRDAQANGHSSLCLKQLGVPLKPEG